MNKGKYSQMKDYYEEERRMLNEMSDADTIYDFSQTGPQEEPHTQEYKIDLNKYYNYKKSKFHSNLNKRNLFK